MTSVAIGFFDGVHLGHRRILAGADVAVTFRNHPLAVLRPERAPHLILSLADRVAAIRSCGVREVRVLDFTPELAALSPEAFIDAGLCGTGRFAVRCGSNWRFGKDAAGDAAWLRARGIPVAEVPAAVHAGAPISSTRIRAALARGDFASVSAMLGRPLAVSGTVFAGKGRGRTLGFPTVNVRPAFVSADIPLGVYGVSVGGVRALANYGCAPTWGAAAWTAPVFEIHFPTPPAALPAADARVDLSLVRFLRPERAFPSVDALRAQISDDLTRLSTSVDMIE